MPTLRQLIPDAETVVEMHPADLAGYILEVLLTLKSDDLDQWNRRNFCMQAGIGTALVWVSDRLAGATDAFPKR